MSYERIGIASVDFSGLAPQFVDAARAAMKTVYNDGTMTNMLSEQADSYTITFGNAGVAYGKLLLRH